MDKNDANYLTLNEIKHRLKTIGTKFNENIVDKEFYIDLYLKELNDETKYNKIKDLIESDLKEINKRKQEKEHKVEQSQKKSNSEQELKKIKKQNINSSDIANQKKAQIAFLFIISIIITILILILYFLFKK